MAGACLEKCEGSYGALSDCGEKPEPKPKEEEESCDSDKDPDPDPLTPDCTFQKWKAGKC